MLTLEEGKMAVRLAREALTKYIDKKTLIKPDGLPAVFDEKRGVFVTLHLEGELRGCIGYPSRSCPWAGPLWTRPSMPALEIRAFHAFGPAS